MIMVRFRFCHTVSLSLEIAKQKLTIEYENDIANILKRKTYDDIFYSDLESNYNWNTELQK